MYQQNSINLQWNNRIFNKPKINGVFLDTGYFKAINDENDFHHEEAVKIKQFLEEYHETTVINSVVLLETLNASVKLKIPANELYKDIISNNVLFTVSKDEFFYSLNLNFQYNNSINLADCIILTSMITSGIKRIVTFDSDFNGMNNVIVISSM